MMQGHAYGFHFRVLGFHRVATQSQQVRGLGLRFYLLATVIVQPEQVHFTNHRHAALIGSC